MLPEEINIEELIQEQGIQFYNRGPKIITVVGHANHSDDTEFHCIWIGHRFCWATLSFLVCSQKKKFTVPKQIVKRYRDPKFGDYFAIRVRPQFRIDTARADEFWLFCSAKDTFAFLVPIEEPEEEVAV